MRLIGLVLTLSFTLARFVTEAQHAVTMARVGILSPTAPVVIPNQPAVGVTEGLTRRLHELGWVEGKNLVVERRFADGRFDRLPGLAANLVRVVTFG